MDVEYKLPSEVISIKRPRSSSPALDDAECFGPRPRKVTRGHRTTARKVPKETDTHGRKANYPWTPSQDEVIRKMYAKHGSTWHVIAEELNKQFGVTGAMVCSHWRSLKKY
ncbi:hypothetical protein BC832DRAFT_541571 [Gaertneriomyces semiglobifer]|nr:hypothetical protein BC832DRAFT_541571 [Gaertneriomyces semiglobifer]